MFGSEIIDVVIGMIFVFLLLSLICSSVNELIESWLNKRADYLEQGIKELLSGEEGGTELVKELYEHRLIAGLFRGKYGKGAILPSYIPARNFALALMDIVAPADSVKKSGSDGATTPPNVTNPIQALRDAVNTNEIINDEVKKALLSLIDAAGDDAAKARQNIENWFNSSMDRVSGWYKRRTHAIILVLGLAVTVFINADAITISNSLSHDKALRDSLAASAQEYAKSDAVLPSASPSASPAPSPSPVAATKEVKDACEKSKNEKGVCSPACLDNVKLPQCKLDESFGKIKDLGLPIGWDRTNLKLVPNDLWGWLLKIFGWLITAFAISLGAPFWFDLLNKFMVVRSTIKPHEKSREDESKD